MTIGVGAGQDRRGTPRGTDYAKQHVSWAVYDPNCQQEDSDRIGKRDGNTPVRFTMRTRKSVAKSKTSVGRLDDQERLDSRL